MTVDTSTPEAGRFARGRRAFRAWRKRRPFWGGFWLIMAGIELFYSGNLNLTALTVHLGVSGFLSYIIPLFVVLCGALVWVTPALRLMYGILALAATVYSIVSVNLGGWLIGLILGMVGGGLTVAWVPDKSLYAKAAKGGAGTEPEPELETGFEGAPYEEATPTAELEPVGEGEGEQRQPFRGPEYAPRHAVPDHVAEPDPDATGGLDPVAEFDPVGPEPATAPGDGAAGPDRAPRWAGGADRRTLALLIAGTTLAAVALAVGHGAAPAAADQACTPTPLQSAISNAVQHGGTRPKPGRTKPATTATRAPAVVHHAAPIAQGSSLDVSGGRLGLLGSVVGGLLGTGTADPSPSDSAAPTPSDPPPSASSAPAPAPAPSSSRPAPRRSPSSAPPSPTRTSTRSKPTRSAHPAPPASSPPPQCKTVARLLSAAGQVRVNERPSTQTAALLTMSGLSYDGNVNLPTASGTIEAMRFSMTSSTSTPFQLLVPVGKQQLTITSSSLTVSGHVTFFTSEIKGNLLGVLPVDFTPASPPPLVVPELFFTDATIALVDVECDSLTAADLKIGSG